MKYLMLFIVVFLISCGEKNDTTVPLATANQFYDSLQKNNIEGARALIWDKENLPNDGSTSFDIDKFEIIKSSIDKNRATLVTKTINSMGTLTFDTIVEEKNGDWKVNMQVTMKNMISGALEKNQKAGHVEITIESK